MRAKDKRVAGRRAGRPAPARAAPRCCCSSAGCSSSATPRRSAATTTTAPPAPCSPSARPTASGATATPRPASTTGCSAAAAPSGSSYPKAGKHVEFDWSRQVLVLAKKGRPYRTYHASSGTSATPTVFGTYRFYRKTPGTNAKGMVHSNYFIGGYAIHGYASVPNYPASHGCIRVPIPNALSIHNWIDIGDRIFVYTLADARSARRASRAAWCPASGRKLASSSPPSAVEQQRQERGHAAPRPGAAAVLDDRGERLQQDVVGVVDRLARPRRARRCRSSSCCCGRVRGVDGARRSSRPARASPCRTRRRRTGGSRSRSSTAGAHRDDAQECCHMAHGTTIGRLHGELDRCEGAAGRRAARARARDRRGDALERRHGAVLRGRQAGDPAPGRASARWASWWPPRPSAWAPPRSAG